MAAITEEVTQLLRSWGDGDQEALEKLVPLVYAELRRLARGYMRGEREGHTLQTTALINEAFLRLTDWKNVSWQNRAHFFGVSAQLMGRILVNSDSTWAGLLLWCRLQGFAKSAHPWLISSHPFGVEELRPMGGAEYVTVFMLVCTKLQRPSRAPGLIWKIRYRIYEIVYLQ